MIVSRTFLSAAAGLFWWDGGWVSASSSPAKSFRKP